MAKLNAYDRLFILLLYLVTIGVLALLSGCTTRPPRRMTSIEIRDCRITERATDRKALSCHCDNPVVSEQLDAETGKVRRFVQCAKNEKVAVAP